MGFRDKEGLSPFGRLRLGWSEGDWFLTCSPVHPVAPSLEHSFDWNRSIIPDSQHGYEENQMVLWSLYMTERLAI